MSRNPLLSIDYDGEIVYDEKARDKNGEKIYYRYLTEVDDSLFYKRYRLRDDEYVRLIRSWYNRWTNVHLLELFVFLIELGGRGSSADTVDDSPLSGAVRQNIRRTMVDLNIPHEGSQERSNVEVRNADMMGDDVESHEGFAIRDPMMDQYEVNPDDRDDADDEPPEISDDGDEEEEMNYYGDTQFALTQPAISRQYGRLDHFSRLNLDAMTSDWSFTQGGPKEDPSNEFEVGQQFQNKEEVMFAVKRSNNQHQGFARRCGESLQLQGVLQKGLPCKTESHCKNVLGCNLGHSHGLVPPTPSCFIEFFRRFHRILRLSNIASHLFSLISAVEDDPLDGSSMCHSWYAVASP
ncbi:hypothetical protein AHAS_Ahas04G0143800 [Arachis hypogaea]